MAIVKATSSNTFDNLAGSLLQGNVETYNYTLQHIDTSMAVSGWRHAINPFTTPDLPKGYYLIFFALNLASAQPGIGLASTRLLLNGIEAWQDNRLVLPTGGATMAGQLVVGLKHQGGTMTFDAQTYPLYQAVTSGCIHANMVLARIGDIE